LPQLIAELPTPALILDIERFDRNVDRMAARAHELSVPLRPHGKTPKSGAAATRLMQAGIERLTVSTLREAEGYFAAGVRDIFYAVALAPDKVGRVAALIQRGVRMICLVDHADAVRAISAAANREAVVVSLVIEIDIDGYRTGIRPTDNAVETLAALITDLPGVEFAGIMSYGGASYGCSPAAAADLAETHRNALTAARDSLAVHGLPCPIVSFGSSPAVLHARSMDGITELRCGIFLFQDLFQAAIGACAIDDIAVSVLATVIGLRPDLNRVAVDAGGLAMSKDLSTARTERDMGYGLVCDVTGQLIDDIYMATTSQELGLLTTFSGAPLPFDRLQIGTKVRILPNHADMTAAAYERYHVVRGGGDVLEVWERFNGW